jgi:hypothetical protein
MSDSARKLCEESLFITSQQAYIDHRPVGRVDHGEVYYNNQAERDIRERREKRKASRSSRYLERRSELGTDTSEPDVEVSRK